MNTARRAAILLFLLIVALTTRGSAKAQSSDVLFFPETGHHVRGDFLRYYNSVRDPKLIFGYPITEQITSKDGKTVQYFQRVRFELRTDLAQRVQLTPVGEATYKTGSQQLSINNLQSCELFPTGFRVCFAFLDFFKLNDGGAQFGNPISPFEYHENLIVQYFERARFEWRGDRPEGQRVVLTDLGRYYFEQLGEDTVHLRPIKPLDATINPILSIKARAFVMKPVALSSGKQTVHIVVQSRNKPAGGQRERKGDHPIHRWSCAGIFLQHRHLRTGKHHLRFCRSKARGNDPDRYYCHVSGTFGNNHDVVPHLVLDFPPVKNRSVFASHLPG